MLCVWQDSGAKRGGEPFVVVPVICEEDSLTRNIKSNLSSVMIQIVTQFFNRSAAYIRGYNIPRGALLFVLAGFYTLQANGQSFPVQPVRILVGFPPGGGVDIVARAVGEKLSEVWGQPVIIENRPGANAIIATELLVKATPNGYTLQLSSPGALVISPNMGTRLSYDPLRDIAQVTVVSESAALLVVNPSVPVNSVKELISFAKAKPGELRGGPTQLDRISGFISVALRVKPPVFLAAK